MEMIAAYPNIAAACRHMDCSGGMRFSSDEFIEPALAKCERLNGIVKMQKAEADLARFAADHAFAHQWAGQGQDDEGNEPPIAAETNAILEDIYND